MATQALEPAHYSSGPEEYVVYPEAGSQSFKQGQFVLMESDGQVAACADDATSILGMATHDASGVEDTPVTVLLAQDGTRFRMNIYHATPASAVAAETMRDAKWGLEVDSSRCYVDVGQGSADALMIVRFLDAIGDTYAKCEACVIPAAQQLGATGT